MEEGRQRLKQTIEGFRLSPQQRQLWPAQGEGLHYLSQCVIALEGQADVDRLVEALRRVVRRHESLRTRFESLPGMDLPIQVVEEEVPLAFRDLRQAGFTRALEEERAPFDLRTGPPVRFALALHDGENALIVTTHALCSDLWSLNNLAVDIGRAYRDLVPGDEPLQYIQFSDWQNDLLEEPDGDGEEARAFWSREAESRLAPALLPLGTTDGGCSPFPAKIRLELPAAPLERAAVPDSSLRTLVLVCWGLVLARFAGVDELPVETLFEGRRFPELREAVGLFGKYIPVRLRGPGRRSLRAELARTEERLREMEKREDLFIREDGHDPVPAAAVGFEYEELEAGFPRIDGIRLLERNWFSAPFPVRLSAVKTGDTLELFLLYDPVRCTPAAGRRLAASLKTLLSAAARTQECPTSELDVLSPEDHHLLSRWNETITDLPGDLVLHRRFAAQAARTPDALAVIAPDGQVSYRELQERVERLARSLIAMDVMPESKVAIALERSVDQVAALLAVIEAGGAYVPLDPLQPAGRFAAMLEDSGAAVLICHDRSALELPEKLRTLRIGEQAPSLVNDGTLRQVESGPENLAYLLFTSGSTGRPKSTLIEHRSVVNLGLALQRAIYSQLGEKGQLRVTLNAPLSFDASVKQWIQLLEGHALLIVPEEIRVDGEAFLAWLERNRADVLDCTPSQLRLLLDSGLDGGGRSYPSLVLVGGEAIDPALWTRLAADRERLYFNVYGPTECTVDTTACRIEPGVAQTIGGPLANIRIHVLDGSWRAVPIGVTGELCVAGAGLARGYAGHAALTADRFIPDPFSAVPGARLYRTGDLARFREEGRLEFQGRLDHQVKIRGMRVELGEIEAALARHPDVAQAVVLLREDQPGRPRLVGYVVPRHFSTGGMERHPLPNGLRLAHQNRNETEYLYREIFENRCYVQHGLSLPDDACVFDVGANIGMFTLFVHEECERPRVYAFEPLPAIFDCLAANCGTYGPDVKLFRLGLSDRERSERFTYYPRYSMMSGLAEYARPESEVEVVRRFLQNQIERGVAGADALLAEAGDLLADRFRGDEVEVRLRRLSDVFREEQIGRVDLLKVDVQRAELDVLRGIDDEHWELIDQVVLEVHDAAGEPTQGNLERVRDILETRGYRVTVEQDDLLAGTDRYNVYAVRQGLKPRASAQAPGPSRLAARAAGDLSAESLRDFARRWLPEFMLPADLILLDELPYTRHGKVDRSALPAPEEVTAAARPVSAPRTPVEEVLVGLFAEILGADRVGADESFFNLGGHSLLATQLMSRVRETFRLELPLRLLFERPTPAQLAEALEPKIRSGAVPVPTIERAPRHGDLPLSFAQQRLWFLQQFDPSSTAYNNPKALRVRGSLDTRIVAATLTEVIRRHEILRTIYPTVAGEPVQRIQEPAPAHLSLVDLQGLPEGARVETARDIVRKEAVRAFDLTREVPVRFHLLRIASDDHVLLCMLHHICADAWSLSVLDREVIAIHQAFSQGQPSPLPDLPLQYADFARWQRGWLQGETLQQHLAFWKKQLAGAPLVLDLAVREPRPAAAARRLVNSVASVPPAVSAALRSLSRSEGVTLFMMLMAAFHVLVARFTGRDDNVVGTGIAGRDRAETEGLIGFFINMLPFRVDLSDRPTFRQLLSRIRETALGAYAHQNLPFERLVEEVQVERTVGMNPVCQVSFGLQNAPSHPLALPDLKLESFAAENEEVRFELSVWMWDKAESLGGLWAYDASRLLPETIERLQRSFVTLLERVVNDLDVRVHEIELADEEERAELDQMAQRLKQSNLERFRKVRTKTAGA